MSIKSDYQNYLDDEIQLGDPSDYQTNFTRIDSEVAKYASDARIDISPEDNKRLKRLIDKRVLSIMIFTYFLQALDKGTMSFASIMGIREDAHLVAQDYSWLTTCIYLAVLTVEYPTNWIIQRVPIAKYLSINIMLWGTCLALHAAAKDFVGLVVLRTLLGAFEACCQPSFIVLSSMWYRREEQAQTVAYWYMMNGGQQIVGGLLAYSFSNIPNSAKLLSWQALFISYGIGSVFWGFFVFCYMPDSPMRAKCFSEDDKRLMVERVRDNQTGIQNRTFRKEQVIEAFCDPQTWCFALVQLLTTLPTSGLGAFANIVIQSFHFSVLQTQLLAMVLGAYIIIVLLGSAYLVKRTGQNTIVMFCSVVPAIGGSIILMTVKDTSRGISILLLISYYVCLSFWACATIGLALVSRNVAGQTKKTCVVAINFVSWAVGNSIGPQVFLSWNAPRYYIAFCTHLGCYAVLLSTLVFLRWWYIKENARKDKCIADGFAKKDDDLKHSFEDLTDRENYNFRYVY
ncbi:major facilitator superfamily domain-containing protein [Trichophaea hybrida]|nr:major facilitator superfamily domain-containing protein [Trichophaea hybrida]